MVKIDIIFEIRKDGRNAILFFDQLQCIKLSQAQTIANHQAEKDKGIENSNRDNDSKLKSWHQYDLYRHDFQQESIDQLVK